MIDSYDNGPQQIDCVSASFCVAVDGAGQAFIYDGTGWSGPQTVDADGGLRAISCSSANSCTALADNSTEFSYDGTSWTEATLPYENEYGIYDPTSISCPTASFCAAAIDEPTGAIATYNSAAVSAAHHN